mmetsp:Transcript_11945/g.22122  ORF Transcript_11945/g.22122 Transcript_11945/m.22122 type:complete len:214 (+) Transcript_11945:4261-4902(+)
MTFTWCEQGRFSSFATSSLKRMRKRKSRATGLASGSQLTVLSAPRGLRAPRAPASFLKHRRTRCLLRFECSVLLGFQFPVFRASLLRIGSVSSSLQRKVRGSPLQDLPQGPQGLRGPQGPCVQCAQCGLLVLRSSLLVSASVPSGSSLKLLRLPSAQIGSLPARAPFTTPKPANCFRSSSCRSAGRRRRHPHHKTSCNSTNPTTRCVFFRCNS